MSELAVSEKRSRIAKYVLASAAGAVLIGLVLHFVLRPPQMGADEDVFKTVDALYTAVRMRDAAKLTQCETRLHEYRSASKLSDSSADYLDGVIAKARSGNWDSAAERLYDFMRVQRREGRATPVESHPKKSLAK